ncbi:MAG: DUF4115 domain-containing protein [Alphaproteobacteria bacterium]|nr:DUF4115 domain-containing protein [Alphaproteobacteria bacterium]
MSKASRSAADTDRRKSGTRDSADDGSAPKETIGAELRAARLRLGEDVASISEQLRIRKEHIEAIEAGNLAGLPGKTYAIGFVRAYAEYLGLDPVEAVRRFKEEIGAKTERADLVFPDPSDDAKLSQGSILLLAVLLGAGIWGGWYLSVSGDRVVSEVVPDVPERLQASTPAPNAVAVAPAPLPTGENAVATEGSPGLAAEGETAAATGEEAAAADEEGAGDTVTAALDPAAAEAEDTAPTAPEGVGPAPADAAPAADETASVVPSSATGQIYGAQHSDARIVVVAKQDTWLRIEDQSGQVYINRSIRAGDAYRAPNRPGLILIARDAGSLDLFVDGAGVGAAGPSGMVLTGMPLNPRFLQTRGAQAQE